MALNATQEARQELAELRERIVECRRELGISNSKATRHSTKRTAGLFRRGLRNSRQARRQAPVT
jgi:predicted DNA-binding transcriptional regulator